MRAIIVLGREPQMTFHHVHLVDFDHNEPSWHSFTSKEDVIKFDEVFDPATRGSPRSRSGSGPCRAPRAGSTARTGWCTAVWLLCRRERELDLRLLVALVALLHLGAIQVVMLMKGVPARARRVVVARAAGVGGDEAHMGVPLVLDFFGAVQLHLFMNSFIIFARRHPI